MSWRIVRVTIVCMLVLASTGIVAATTAGAAARRGKAVQGVTDKEIEIAVLTSDLDKYRQLVSALPAKLTNENVMKRHQLRVDEFGPINGRTVKLVPVFWDVGDVTTYDRACTELTQDVKPFMAVNVGGWRPQLVPCVTVDNKTPLFLRDPVQESFFKASGDKLWTLLPASDVLARAQADIVVKQKLVPKTATIGILASNDPGAAAAADALEGRLKKLGYKVPSRVDINALNPDVTALNRESAAAVATFDAAGVDTVFSGIQPTQIVGYYQEAARSGKKFDTWWLEDAPGMCTALGVTRVPVEAAGTHCVTATDTTATASKTGIKTDTKFEAQCRAAFEKAFNEKTTPGAPTGDLTVNGVTYVEDTEPDLCTMFNGLLLPAIKKAGKDLTWAKVAANLKSTKSAPAAELSDGEASFGPGKQYAADSVHVVTLTNADRTTQADANGLFNGCPIPAKCWVPQTVNGTEWFPITNSQN